MKELAYEVIEDLSILLSLAFFIFTIFFLTRHKEEINNAHSHSFYSGSDIDTNLSGNSGISSEYYSKQVRDFFDSKRPFD